MAESYEKQIPVYMRIYNELSGRIFKGEWSPGNMLPSENMLCADYGTSRVTVRKALKELETKGLVFALPRKGYYVCNPHHNDYMVPFSENLLGCLIRYKDVTAVLPDEEVARALQIPKDSMVIKITRVIYKGGSSVALDIKYMPYDRGYPSVESEIHYSMFPEIAAAKAMPFDYYTEMEIKAQVCDETIAEQMECAPGEALLVVCRNFITRDGKHIAYGKHYMRQPFRTLHGTSGYRTEED